MTTTIKYGGVIMVAGGKRDKAGRKPGEPTKQVRIPVAGADAARALTDYFLTVAKERLHDTVWYRTCPEEQKKNITLRMVGIKREKYGSLISGNVDVPVVVAIAEDANIGESLEIELRLDRI